MTANTPINGPGNDPKLRSVGAVGGRGSAEGKPSSEGAGTAFKAMLDRLQQQAQTLSADSEAVEKPEDLSGAVGRARATLDDALSLSDKLLEAYREATQQQDSKGTEGPAQ